jgi:putative serine/threonine protein kinase
LSPQNISSVDELAPESPGLVPIISYPSFGPGEYSERIAEMKSLGVTGLITGNGRSTVNGISIAGKGWVGLVLKARIGGRICALKIRRVDADRKDMEDEARIHSMANDAGVGPALFGHTKNLIAMEFIEGQTIAEWIRSASAADARSVAGSVLKQCRILDKAGIDHGELSRLGRHVIVTGNIPCIIDFESASTLRKTSNVTAAVQALFLFGAIAGHMKKMVQVDNARTIDALREYKDGRTDAGFTRVMETLPI